ncbi:MAG: carboxypeptidase regulatory-like domain-containing protein [Planctomycetes bacterium]|nr:carboxypeptidase regulatory-like domain-containing protein [Planctomycetota bacterium]
MPRIIVGAGMLLVLLGCDSGPPLHTVSGTVILKGKAIEGAVVRFMPEGATEGFGGQGVTDATGKYEVIAGNMNQRKGLPAGKYKVVITCLRRPDGSAPDPNVPPIESDAKEHIPEPYSNRRDTPLTATIGSEPATVDFTLPLKMK